ncbi:MAG: IPT/TIG domain-containing protein, partial [Vicinamibacteraceae bacterium]
DTALVGAWTEDWGDSASTNRGAAYVFVRSGETWTEQAKLTASDGVVLDRFGGDVFSRFDTALVGAITADVNGNADQGAAYVFVRSGGVWTEQAKLTASDGAANDQFGRLEVGDDIAIVGAQNADIGGNANQGAAYVFIRSGDTWTEQQKLTSSDGAAGDQFGNATGLTPDANIAVIGAPGADVDGAANQGAAYIFTRSGDTWTEQQRLTSSDGAAEDQLGFTVRVSGTTAIVGSFQSDVNGADQGAAYVFTLAAPTITEITPPTGDEDTEVTIIGDNFDPDVVVIICGQQITPTSVTPTEIVFIAPPCVEGGPQDVTVQNPDGQSDTEPDGFTYPSDGLPPTIDEGGITPPSGPLAGGTAVTITGTNFTPDATVSFGGNPGTSVQVPDANTIQVVTPPGAAPGPVDVVVTTPAGSATAEDGFTYLPDGVVPPNITNVTPPTGDEGTEVTIDGDGFQDGAEVTICGQTVPATFISANQITFVAPPCDEPGVPQDVTVQNPDAGSDTEPDAFAYPPIGDPPVFDPPNEISPRSGPVSGGTVVTIKGDSFTFESPDGPRPNVTEVTFDGAPGTNLVVHDSGTLEVTTPPAPSGQPGPVDVVVVYQILSDTSEDGFTYTADGIVPPDITDVSPPSGPPGTEVTTDGEDFQDGATITICGQVVTPISVTPTQIVFEAPPCDDEGPQDVTVTNPDGGSDTEDSGFDYDEIGEPTVTSVDPNRGPHAGGVEVIVIGTNFVADSEVTFGDLPATDADVLSPTVIRATVPPSGVPTTDDFPVAVAVTNPEGSGVLPDGFTYTDQPAGPPTIDEGGITPPSGPVSGGTQVTITGTNFTPDATVSFGGKPAPSVEVLNPNTIQTITPPGDAPGPVDVTVTTPAGSDTAEDGFTYTPDGIVPPTITDVTPPTGDDGDEVTVDGDDFQDGAEVTICGQTVPATFVSANQITFVAPPCDEPGVPQDVTVTNPDDGSDTEPGGFTYGEPHPPTVTKIDPDWGPHAGGTETIITGANFVPGTTVTFGDVPAASVEIITPTTLRAVTPPSADPGPAPVPVDVTVTTPAGDATIPDGFTYTTPTGDDSDGDGMTDDDETDFGLDPNDPTGDNGADGDPDGDGMPNDDEVNGDPPSHPRGFFTQHFAEGATGNFFKTDIGVLNASRDAAANVLVTLLPETGAVPISLRQMLNPLQRMSVDANEQLAGAEIGVSARVESDRPVGGMRQMFWDRSAYGSAMERGQPDTSTTWLFSEGATYVFDVFFLLENPNREPANVTLQYLRGEGQGPPIVQEVQVAPSSRQTIYANLVPGLENVEFAVAITSDLPIVAERSMFISLSGLPFEGGQTGAGVTDLSTTWHFAEAATQFFDTFLLLGNPGDTDAQVTVTYQFQDATTLVKEYPVFARSRQTVLVDTEDPRLAETIVAIAVESTQPITAERAMWWGPTSDTWYEAHASAGTTETGTAWVVGDAMTGGPNAEDTYLLLSNDTTTPAQVAITLIYDDGSTEQETVEVAAQSRMTRLVTTDFPASEGRRYSILVESVSVPITVDVSRYQSTNSIFGNGGGTALATRIR